MTEVPTGGGLAWPPHPHDPNQPPSAPVLPGATRKPLDMWDRTKFIILGLAIFGLFVWNEVSDNPLLPIADAFRSAIEDKTWLFALLAIEILRQINYLIAEHSPAYHAFWSQRVFGGMNRRIEKSDPWRRYRVARAIKYFVAIIIFGAIVGAITGESLLAALFHLPATLYSLLPTIIQVVLIMFIAVGQFVAIFWFMSKGGVEVYFPDDIQTRFTDVWGQDPVVERVQENLVFLENPESIEDKGGYVPGGLLLWGPPGTGKTLIAEAVAGETGKPFVFVEPGAFNAMFFGVGILKVKALFRKLRKLALRYGGVIAFFDEADSLGSRGGAVAGAAPTTSAFDHGCNGISYASATTRNTLMTAQLDAMSVGDHAQPRGFVMGGMNGGGGGMGTLQALLAEMSGLKKPRGFLNRHLRRVLGMKPKPPPKYRIFIMMASNLPDVLDPALLRPGRIDRIYHVGYPSTEGRERTFRGYFDKVTHNITDEQLRTLSVISRQATGASIKDIVNEALVIAIRDGREVVTYQDALRAKHLKEHGPADDWTYSDWEGHAVAVHEACHAIAMYALKKREAIDVATIERRGSTGGFVAPVPLEDQFVHWKSEQESEVMTFLASLAGERLFFDGNNSQGVGGDLRASTTIVLTMLTVHGMGDTVASLGVSPGFIGRNPSVIVEDGTDRQFLETDMGRQVEAKLKELLIRVGSLLERNAQHVLAVAHALETHKTVSGEDIVAIIEGGVGPLVDGRRYQDPVVVADIAAYHDSVLRAMNANSRVDRPLPSVNGYHSYAAPAPPAPVPAPVPAAGRQFMPPPSPPAVSPSPFAAPPAAAPPVGSAAPPVPPVAPTPGPPPPPGVPTFLPPPPPQPAPPPAPPEGKRAPRLRGRKQDDGNGNGTNGNGSDGGP